MWDSCRSGHNIVHESVQDHSLHKENVEFEKYTNMCRSGHKIAVRVHKITVRVYKIEMLSPDYCNRTLMFYSHTSALNDIVKCMGLCHSCVNAFIQH